MENNGTEIKSETTTDLQSRFAAATQEKTPGASRNASKPTGFWDASDDDFDVPKPKVETKVNPESTTGKPNENPESTESKPTDNKVKLPESVHKSSATVVVGLMGLATRSIITPIHT